MQNDEGRKGQQKRIALNFDGEQVGILGNMCLGRDHR